MGKPFKKDLGRTGDIIQNELNISLLNDLKELKTNWKILNSKEFSEFLKLTK